MNKAFFFFFLVFVFQIKLRVPIRISLRLTTFHILLEVSFFKICLRGNPVLK